MLPQPERGSARTNFQSSASVCVPSKENIKNLLWHKHIDWQMDLQPASQSRSNSKSTPAASMPDSTPTVQGKNMAQSAQGKFELMWQEGMNGLTTRAYIGYSRPKKKTVVLLLSWDDASDDLEVRKEVSFACIPFKTGR